MGLAQWLPALASVVVVSSGIIFFGYGIVRERLKAAREREKDMLAAMDRQAQSIDELAKAIELDRQRRREESLREDNQALLQEVEELKRRLS